VRKGQQNEGFLSGYGIHHMLECHYPMDCYEAECSHYLASVYMEEEGDA
jgi:hypothetical protein